MTDERGELAQLARLLDVAGALRKEEKDQQEAERERQALAAQEAAERVLEEEAPPPECVTDPLAWVEWARPHIEDDQRGLVPFEPFDFQVDLIRAFARGEMWAIPKSSQVGATTGLIAGGFCHQLLFRQEATGIPFHGHIVANKREVAVDRLLQIAKTALSTARLTASQRERLRGINPLTHNSAIYYYTEEGQNYIVAHSSAPSETRSFAGNAALFEEVAYMPYAEEAWRSVTRMVKDPGNFPLFAVSTYAGDGDFFCHLVDEAKSIGLNCLPLTWRARPDRDEQWAKAMKALMGEREFREEHELIRMRPGELAIDFRLIESWARKTPFLGSGVLKEHRYSKGVDTSGKGDCLTVHTAIDLFVRPAQTVYQRKFPQQTTPEKIAAIEKFDRQFAGPIFIDGTHDEAVAVLPKCALKTAIHFTSGSHETRRVDRVEGVSWRNVPRASLLSWGAANLENGIVLVHPEEFPDLFVALKTAQRATEPKAHGKNVDELDSWLLANLGLSKRVREGTGKASKVMGGKSHPSLRVLRERY